MKKIILVVLTFFLFSCVPRQDFDNLQLDNKKLNKEIRELKLQLEECQFGAGKLLDKILILFEEKNYIKCKNEISLLLKTHAGSVEAKEGHVILDKINKEEQKIAKINKEEREKKLKKEKLRLSEATKRMRVQYDDMDGISWYYDKSSPQYASSTGLYIYIGKRNSSILPWMRLRIQYSADNWLFVEKFKIKVDGQTFIINEEKYGEIERDSGRGDIWEWLDRGVGNSEYEIIKAVANGKDVKIRYIGKKYHVDKTITAQQKQALKNVIDAYEAIGGRLR